MPKSKHTKDRNKEKGREGELASSILCLQCKYARGAAWHLSRETASCSIFANVRPDTFIPTGGKDTGKNIGLHWPGGGACF